MANPSSIEVSCVDLIKAAEHVVTTIKDTTQEHSEATGEIRLIAEEIEKLKDVLVILQPAVHRDDATGQGLARRTTSEIGKLETVLREVQELVTKWATTGHAHAQELLETLRDGRTKLEFVQETLASMPQVRTHEVVVPETAHLRNDVGTLQDNNGRTMKFLQQQKKYRNSPFQEVDVGSGKLLDSPPEKVSDYLGSSSFSSPDGSLVAHVGNSLTEGKQPAKPTIRLVVSSIEERVRDPVGSGKHPISPNSGEKRLRDAQSRSPSPFPSASNSGVSQTVPRNSMIRDDRAISISRIARHRLQFSQLQALNQSLQSIDEQTSAQSVEALLRQGANPNAAVDAEMGTEGSRPALHQAIRSRNMPCLTILLKYGVDFNATVEGISPLEAAVCCGNAEAVGALLQQGARKGDIKIINKAISNKDPALVKLLLSNNVAVDQTSLKLAVSMSQTDMVDSLLAHGVAPDDSTLDEAVSRGISNGIYDTLKKLLGRAVSLSKVLFKPAARLPRLLLSVLGKLTAAVSTDTIRKATAVFTMMFKVLLETVGSARRARSLLEKHGLLQRTISLAANHRDNALGISFCQARRDLCKLILASGINVNAESECSRDQQQPHSPLICALKHQDVVREDKTCADEIVHILVTEHGAAVNPANGERPLRLAARAGYQGATNLLLKSSAAYNPMRDPQDLHVLEDSIDQNWTMTTAKLLQKCPITDREYIKNKSSTFLCTAAGNRNEIMTQNLLSSGFDADRSSIRRAVEMDLTATVARMMTSIGEDEAALSHLKKQASSILRMAILNENAAIARIFLQEGIRGGIGTFTIAVENGMTETLSSLMANRIRYNSGGDKFPLSIYVENWIRIAVESRNQDMFHCLWNYHQGHRFPRIENLLRETVSSGNTVMAEFLLCKGRYCDFSIDLLDEAVDPDMTRMLWQVAAKGHLQPRDFPGFNTQALVSLLRRAVSMQDEDVLQDMFQAAGRRERARKWGFLAAHIASSDSNIKRDTKELIMRHPANLDGAMLIAAERQSWRRVWQLVRDGADVNYGIADPPPSACPEHLSCFPLLFHAIYALDRKAVRRVIAENADTGGAFDAGRDVAFDSAVRGGKRLTAQAWTPLHVAVLLVAEEVLAAPAGAAPRSARYECALDIVRQLVDSRADPDLRLSMTLKSWTKTRLQWLSARDLAKMAFPRFSRSWRKARSELLSVLDRA